MEITLSGAFAPPTFGAVYNVAIPEGTFKDEFNTNSPAYTASHNLDGVNKPVVRVQKKRAGVRYGTFLQQNRETWAGRRKRRDHIQPPPPSGELDGADGAYAAWGVTATYWQTPGTTLGAGQTPQESG
ncbi:MAG: hypothetical protein LBF60_02765 [Treponema sp.]|nr:hypothetical protein [Treponema sp.]